MHAQRVITLWTFFQGWFFVLKSQIWRIKFFAYTYSNVKFNSKQLLTSYILFKNERFSSYRRFYDTISALKSWKFSLFFTVQQCSNHVPGHSYEVNFSIFRWNMLTNIYWKVINIINYSFMNVPILPISAFGDTVHSLTMLQYCPNKFKLILILTSRIPGKAREFCQF